jgi:CBS domain containing-hemolysin-like protein
VRAEAGDSAARRALAVTRRTSFMLSGAQLGITVTGLIVGYVAEPLMGQSVGTLLGGVGIPVGVSVAIGAIAALLISTLVQMLFGELFPKNLAIARPEPVALWLAASTTLYLRLFGWLIWFFDQASNVVLRLLRVEPVHDVEHSASARDLERIVADSRRSGDLPDELSVMLDRILDFPTRDVEHAMIPRARVDTVADTDTIGHVRRLMAQGHSRYPMLAEGGDVLGVVHLADVLVTDAHDDAPAVTIARAPMVLPALMGLPDALHELTTTNNRLACVVDEYGGFAGVLTVEDLAEELVGEITDEHDPDEPASVPPREEGVWLMAGAVHVDEAERALGVDLPRGDYETVAGLVIAHHGRLPEVGTLTEVPLPASPADLLAESPPRALHVEVVEVERYVPSTVRITLAGAGAGADGAAQGRADGQVPHE